MASTLRRQRPVEGAPDQEPEEGQRESDADDAPEQPVRVFEPEDSLELPEGHAPIDFLILGEALVVGEERLPRLLAEGRQHAHQRPPVHDRESRVVKPRDPAEHDHREHEAGESKQPVCDGAALARDSFGCDAAAAGRPEGRGVHARVGRRQRERLRAR